MKFLIDECLSVALVEMAINAGFPESSHLNYRGMASWKDHKLMPAIIDNDWTFVTRNSDDFRPRPGSKSKAPCYVGQPIHAGLICLNLPPGSGRKEQMAYFQAALEKISLQEDLVNQILEVDPDPKSVKKAVCRQYSFPPHI